MSEDKRKNARLQGRFTNEKDHPSHHERDRQHNKNTTSQGTSEESGGNVKDHKTGQKRLVDGVTVQYSENTNISFKELEKKRKPEEIRSSGVRELSTTRNGTSRIIYEPDFIIQSEADELYEILYNSTKWYDKNIIIHGKEVPQPRLVAWYGPFPYSYSGTVLVAAEMPSVVHCIRERVESYLKEQNMDVTLNSVLLNLYRNEKDSVAWHSDDELTMGVCPTIASVSIGEIRKFEMKPKIHVVKEMEGVDSDTVYFVNLKPGSLIIMDGSMQKDWMHRVPKEFHDKAPRINLTFRTVYPIDNLPSEIPYEIIATTDRLHNSTIAQEEPVFNYEDFPTLSSVDSQKSNTSNVQETSSYTSPSMSPNRYKSDEDISTKVDVTGEEDMDDHRNQNNLNKEMNCIDIVNNDAPSYGEKNNYNCIEPEKSSDAKLPVDQHMLIEPQSSFDYVSEEISHGTGGCKVSNSNMEDRGESRSRVKNRSRLNANAPDFVPQQKTYQTKLQFNHCNLITLANIYYRSGISRDEMNDFMDALFGKLSRIHKSYFTPRDWLELDLLRKISDGNQTEKNQKLINERICCMIRYAENKHTEYRSPQRFQRTVYSSDYNRPKSSYQGNSRRY